ncbi:MAG: MFS transporter, partial [Dehalococcoidia bacterium]|nr:MFS transporter [Dehalococcoidia bacterium]
LAHDFTTLLFVGLLSGFGNGLGSGAVMTLGSDLAPRAGSGEFLGLWRFLTDLGRVAGPTIVGGTAQALALGSASLLSGGFAVAGALVMLLFVAETLQRAPARNLEET